ncbi:HAD-IA family hydrolase [Pelomyxa schiedti]|nr:HAD-IA family hydrolase [Pelomyxa schiedti]
MERLRGFIFDMDGVLVDSEPFIRGAAQTMFLQRYGVVVADEDFMPFVGTGEDRFIGGPAEKHNVTVTLPDDKVETYRIYLESIKGHLKALPGVGEFVTALKRSGIRTAVASAADSMKVEGNLAQLPVPRSYFDAVVTGSDVVKKKPDPACFVLAASRIGVECSKCVVAEDALSGIRAARSAGMIALGLTTTFTEAQLRDAGAHFICQDLAHVPQELLNMLGITGSYL